MSHVVLISNFETVKRWLLEYLGKNGVRKIAFIMDAKTPRIATEPSYIFTDKLTFEDSGIEVVMIKLEDGVDLRKAMSGCDAIYVKGGNSFYLLNAINNSDFRVVANDMLAKGKMYIGESAGAYVACPTIEMAHWKHQDKDIVGLTDLTGLSLVPFLVSAHYDDSLAELLAPHIDECRYDVEVMRDNEAMIYDSQKTIKYTVNA